MRDLPTGTVTFLFTDIEGSTRLLHELGDGYAAALAEHRRLLRECFAAHGGVEVDTQGDAFFVAFQRASDAVAAAEQGQRGLADGPIRVRMGIHTGEPTVTEEGYVGLDVHRAARVKGAGHGGQVLLSAMSRGLAAGHVFQDLGEHRLKDQSAPQRLFQLGGEEFPPLKTLYRTNLPVPATPFLGRARELEQVSELLARTHVRLLTLTGPGGTGKTRLALQAAAERSEDYPDGVFWVALAPLRDASLVLDSAARALGGEGSLAEQVGERRVLLLLDNFEHLIEAAAGLAELLGTCPRLDLLVTSRELLQLAAEQAYPVPALVDAEAVELFLARARAAQPAFPDSPLLPELCARLDNLPLALELAAARTRVFTPEELLERLSRRLDFLKAGRDADPRQQTLRATIEWSYDLLDPPEQSLFARLAAFAGGCTLAAAEQVCEADAETLVSLLDKASSAGRRTGASGCWRRFASSRSSGWKRRTRLTVRGVGMRTTFWSSPGSSGSPRSRWRAGIHSGTTSRSPSKRTFGPPSTGRSPGIRSSACASPVRSRTFGSRRARSRERVGSRRCWRGPPTLLPTCSPAASAASVARPLSAVTACSERSATPRASSSTGAPGTSGALP